MQNPLFTIITVCYNNVSQIERTLLSVIKQSERDFEYIVIDGGSTDGTVDIIKKYQEQIDIFISEQDNGIYDAMNKGISYSNGTWLNFMNSGDVFSSDEILREVKQSGLLSKFDFIYSDFYVNRCYKLRLIKEDFQKGKLLHQSIFYKKKLHKQYGLYWVTHPYIVSDYCFFIQIPESLVAKFEKPISINDTNGISMQGDWCGLQKYCVDFMFRKISIYQFFVKVFFRIAKNCLKKIVFFIY